MTREGEPEDELPTNVIAFPKAKVDKVDPTAQAAGAEASNTAPGSDTAHEADAPHAPGEPQAPGETQEPQEPQEPTMTLDAFERAVRAAVRDKLGDEPSSPPRGADELVAQVFSALTGKDAKSALAEVRSRLAEPLGGTDSPDDGEGPEGMNADVIDLATIREARQKQSIEAASKVGHAIKDTLSGFISTLAQRQGHTGEITLDTNFFKQHGPTLLGNLFQSLAASFMQQARSNLSPNSPPPEAAPTGASSQDAPAAPAAPEAEPGSTETPASPPETTEAQARPAQPVQVRLDVGSLLSGLFKRLGRPAQPPDEPQG